MFLFLNLNAVPKKSTLEQFAYFRHFQRIGMNAKKFEKTPIHFKSDVFAAVAVVDAKPYSLTATAKIGLLIGPDPNSFTFVLVTARFWP